MSSIRGRAISVGGMATTEGASAGRPAATRPGYRITAGQMQPIPGSLGLGHPLLDLSSVGAWRLIAVGLALAYVIGFHVTLGRARVGIGPAR